MDPQELVNRIHNLNSFKHRITYYGSSSQEDFLAVINKEHNVPQTLEELPEGIEFRQQPTAETQIYIAPYEAKQIYMASIPTGAKSSTRPSNPDAVYTTNTSVAA